MLLAIGALHAYWAAGGAWGWDAAIPDLPPSAGRSGKAIAPPLPAKIGVAVLLTLAAAIVATRAGLLPSPVSRPLLTVGAWGVAAVLGLRAIGETRYVGFFKRIRDTRFAWWDTRLYSPLCLALALGCAVVAAS